MIPRGLFRLPFFPCGRRGILLAAGKIVQYLCREQGFNWWLAFLDSPGLGVAVQHTSTSRRSRDHPAPSLGGALEGTQKVVGGGAEGASRGGWSRGRMQPGLTSTHGLDSLYVMTHITVS